MTQTSVGFAGTVDDKSFARLGRLFGTGPCLERIGDLPIAVVAGERTIVLGLNAADTNVPRSTIYADGVLTDLDAPERVSFPAPTNGQWFLVVLKRNWAELSTAFEVRNGALTAAAAPTTVPAYPASRLNDPGNVSDVPVAWVWANSATTTLTVVPLLAPSRAVAPRAGTAATRTTVFANMVPINGGAGAFAKFGELAGEWFNSPGSWTDRYFGPRAAVAGSNVDVARPGGWYPVHGQMPSVDFAHDPSYTVDIANSADETTLVGFDNTRRNYWGNGGQGEPDLGLGYGGNGLWSIGQPGRWRLSATGRFASGGGNGGRRGFGARSAARGLIVFDRRGPSSVPWISIATDWVVPAGGDTLSLVASQDNGTTLPFQVMKAHLEYVGPN